MSPKTLRINEDTQMPTKISQIIRSNLSAPLKRKYADNNLLTFDNNTYTSMYLHRPHFRLRRERCLKNCLLVG